MILSEKFKEQRDYSHEEILHIFHIKSENIVCESWYACSNVKIKGHIFIYWPVWLIRRFHDTNGFSLSIVEDKREVFKMELIRNTSKKLNKKNVVSSVTDLVTDAAIIFTDQCL